MSGVLSAYVFDGDDAIAFSVVSLAPAKPTAKRRVPAPFTAAAAAIGSLLPPHDEPQPLHEPPQVCTPSVSIIITLVAPVRVSPASSVLRPS